MWAFIMEKRGSPYSGPDLFGNTWQFGKLLALSRTNPSFAKSEKQLILKLVFGRFFQA
jgi:hypothetical protein